jgi:thiamine-phosphate pyrophosphorylase
MHKKNLNIFCFISDYDKDYIKNLDKKVNIIFRNYQKTPSINKLKNLKNLCKSMGKKVFLANNIKLAQTLRFDGVYIPSFNKKINFNMKKNIKNFTILGSAHNIKEIKEKENQGVDFIFISPVFKVIKSSKYLGTLKFNTLSLSTHKKVIALGGINTFNFKKLNLLRASGFASISYFKKKRPH